MNRHLAPFHLALIILFFSSTTIAQIFKVEPLNDGINTSQYDEISPVVSIDGKTLYFTRVGHPTFERTLKLEGADIATQLNENDYQNKLSIYRLQEQNIKTSQNNFNRTQEKFKLGQVNSIEFRQAQLNLLNAELSRNRAKYLAKLAEFQLLQLSGELLSVNF